jgi:hypothetical protein
MANDTLTDFNRAAQALIIQGLEKAPVFAGTVYRGMIIKRKEFEKIYGGNTVQQNRFISSSMDSDIALKFAIRDQNRMRKSEI